MRSSTSWAAEWLRWLISLWADFLSMLIRCILSRKVTTLLWRKKLLIVLNFVRLGTKSANNSSVNPTPLEISGILSEITMCANHRCSAFWVRQYFPWIWPEYRCSVKSALRVKWQCKCKSKLLSYGNPRWSQPCCASHLPTTMLELDLVLPNKSYV